MVSSSPRGVPFALAARGTPANIIASATFSAALIVETRLNDWKMMPTFFRRWRLSSVLDICARSWSKMRSDPSDGRSSPAIRLSSVDLPDPEVPSRPTNSPCSTVSDTPSRARTVDPPIW